MTNPCPSHLMELIEETLNLEGFGEGIYQYNKCQTCELRTSFTQVIFSNNNKIVFRPLEIDHEEGI